MNKLVVLILTALLLTGCGDPEEKARGLYNKALVAQRSGDVESAREMYNKIVEKYPTTEIAVQVNNSLALQETISDTAREVKKEIYEKIITNSLHLYLLDNGRYPTTEQGLEALISPPSIDPVPMRWREEGYLKNPEDLLWAESYTSEERNSFELIMQ